MASETSQSLHPVLAQRRSIRAFDPWAEVTDGEVALLLEAARWAPSSWNSQPWRFVVASSANGLHKRVLAHLFERNQRWARNAPLLLVGAHLTRSPKIGDLKHASYDLGQAVAHLSVQATALGLHVHQMAGFDAEGISVEFALPEDVRVAVVIAAGRAGSVEELPTDLRDRESANRVRQPTSALVLPVDMGQPAAGP